MPLRDLTGKKYGRLTVFKPSKDWLTGHAKWHCLCSCGNEVVVYISNLTTGKTKSCGCLASEQRGKNHPGYIHGASVGNKVTPEYSAWVNMINRCHNSKVKSYKDYGARGISVCDRWRHSAVNFLSDMGPIPKPGFTIDRIYNDGDYTPENCCWVDRYTQAQNKRTITSITFNSETHCCAEWDRKLGFSKSTTHSRLKYGWSIERALTQPQIKRK